MASNLVMVAVMAIAPVHLVAHGLGLVGIVVVVHVAGMFLPSAVSGRAADRIGPTAVAGGGFLLVVASGVAGFLLDTGGAYQMMTVLLMLGVGWNLGVVGGSALLAGLVPERLRPRAEGIGEVSMGLAAGVGAPTAGVIVAFGGFAALSLAGRSWLPRLCWRPRPHARRPDIGLVLIVRPAPPTAREQGVELKRLATLVAGVGLDWKG